MLFRRSKIINTAFIKSTVPKPGFVKLIDCMPSEKNKMLLDAAVVQAARVSYGEGSKGVEKDSALINYLIKHQHTSPFEMIEFKFHLKMPIYIQRQWIRHRTASVNEISGRYTELNLEKGDVYHPKELREQSKSNKQGSYIDTNLYESNENVKQIWDESEHNIDRQISNYHKLVALGVAKEQARMILPLSTFTEFYWKIDLHNLLNFIKLRAHHSAQREIQLYAHNILDILEVLCPITVEAWKKHVYDKDDV